MKVTIHTKRDETLLCSKGTQKEHYCYIYDRPGYNINHNYGIRYSPTCFSWNSFTKNVIRKLNLKRILHIKAYTFMSV